MLKRWNLYLGFALLCISCLGISGHGLWWDRYYFAFAWVGWVFFVDALSYGRFGTSVLHRMGSRALALFILSIPFWWLYALMNMHLGLWSKGSILGHFEPEFFYIISHSSVLPAVMVAMHFFVPNLSPLIPDRPLSQRATSIFVASGLLAFVLGFFFSQIFFPLIFCFLFLILDPLNYSKGLPSFLFALKKCRFKPLIGFCVAQLILGLFWESLNGIAAGGWAYKLPYFNADKLFFMPILGFFGYIPFGASAFAFYYWFESLFKGKGPIASN